MATIIAGIYKIAAMRVARKAKSKSFNVRRIDRVTKAITSTEDAKDIALKVYFRVH